MAGSIELNYIKKFSGYFNYQDVTNLPKNALTEGSQNVFVLDGVKVATRGGSRFLGAEGTVGTSTDVSWTPAHRIHSHYETFSNSAGVKIPLRAYYSGNLTTGDIVEAWLPLYVNGVAQQAKKWYQITATTPTTPIISKHKYYWAEWFDAVENNNHLVFTYGSKKVSSYTGGYAPIVSKTSNTLTTVSGASWQSFGFVNAPEGINTIVVNVGGVPTEVPLTSGDFSTDTITVASTVGINVDDLAFQALNNDTIKVQNTDTEFIADVCATLANQVYYIDWRQRNILISWAFNQTAFNTNPVYQGTSGLNDAIFTGTFTDTQTDTFKVSIDNVAKNSQVFVGNGINDGYFVTSGYTGTTNNTYRVTVAADWAITFVGTPSIIPVAGDRLVGGTSGAIGRVVFLQNGGQDPVMILETPQGFISGETITGTQGSYGTTASSIGQAWVQTYKNGVAFTPTGFVTAPAYQFLVGTHTLVDGIVFTVGTTNTSDNWVTQTPGDYYELVIGKTDTFSWAKNGVQQASGVPCSLTPTLLSDGVSVNFINTTGHLIGDNWLVSYYPTIHRGWRQTYYTGYGNTPGTTPATNKGSIRLPGEGFKMQLDSNGFTMKVQQNTMYINGSGGEYYEVIEKLSSDLKNQSYSVIRLKTEPQKGALYPYLLSNDPNYIIVVSKEKTWDVLGQQKFLQLPQFKSFSDFVKYDFLSANWLNSEHSYIDRKQWFILPEQGQVFVYDDFKKYWHPPQSFGRTIGSIVVIDNKICAHSYERNETYEIFTYDTNDLGIFPINTNITLSYYDYERRFNKKTFQAIAFDGYMKGNPQIKWTVNGGLNGCEFISNGIIDPIFCNPPDNSSLGKSGYGYHGLGNSPVPYIDNDEAYHGIETTLQQAIPHFVYGKTTTEKNYYLRNIVLECNSMEQLWSITAIGELTKMGLVTNSDIFNPPTKH